MNFEMFESGFVKYQFVYDCRSWDMEQGPMGPQDCGVEWARFPSGQGAN